MSQEPAQAASAEAPVKPALDIRFLSHGTLESRDIERSIHFYRAFLGLEVVRTSKISAMIRRGGQHVYAVVQSGQNKDAEMSFLNHNGLDVGSDAAVDESHRIVTRDAAEWGLHDISKPMVQHGAYSFYFRDGDGNFWEILSNPRGGYSWMFELGDQEGMGHLKRDFARPALDE